MCIPRSDPEGQDPLQFAELHKVGKTLCVCFSRSPLAAHAMYAHGLIYFRACIYRSLILSLSWIRPSWTPATTVSVYMYMCLGICAKGAIQQIVCMWVETIIKRYHFSVKYARVGQWYTGCHLPRAPNYQWLCAPADGDPHGQEISNQYLYRWTMPILYDITVWTVHLQ